MAGRTLTVAACLTLARQRADIESGTARFPDTELLNYFNQGVAELWDLLIASRGEDYYEKSATVTTVAQQIDYPLGPSVAPDFNRSLEVKVTINSNQVSLRRVTRREESIMLSPQPGFAGFPMAYRFFGNDMVGGGVTLRLLPPPTGGLVATVYYLPVAPILLIGGSLDGFNGWEEYPIEFAALLAARKDENDAVIGACTAALERLKVRIAGLAPKRDQAEPPRLNDITLAGRYRWRSRRRYA